ncbi:MAG: hypothetical protein U0229_08275 [Anaeromyxobacter sp.]
MGDWARTDERVRALDPLARERLLAVLDEPRAGGRRRSTSTRGFGLGSLASGDPRGVWLSVADGAATLVLAAGVLVSFGEGGGRPPGEVDRAKRVGNGLIAGGFGLLAVSRVAGLVLPFTFHGRAHHELSRAFADAPAAPKVAAFVLPVPSSRGAGAVGGVAVAF